MKRNLLTGLAFTALTFVGFAQQQPLNSSFETWTGVLEYSDVSPNNWGTLNFDAFGWPRTTYQSGTAAFHQDSNAVLETKAGHSGLGIDDVVGGALYYNFDLFTGWGTPYTSRLQSVAFRYKANHVNGDSSFVYIEPSISGVAIGEGFEMISGNATEWTHFNVPVTYDNATDMPDTLALIIQVSAGSWPFGISDYPAQVGSTLEVDAVVFCQEIQASISTVIVNRTVTFDGTAFATGNGGTGSVVWNFGDGSATTTDADPIHTYAVNNVYTVTMTVTDSCGNEVVATELVTIDSDLAVSEFIENSTFSMYPNPSASDVNLHLVLNNEEDITIELFDVTGRKVSDLYKGLTNDVSIVVEASVLNAGLYNVRVSGSNGGYFQKQLVITK